MAKEVSVRKEHSVSTTFSQQPSKFLEEHKSDAGKGFSTHSADRQVSMIRVLQALSPQIKSTNPAYISGAKEGDILLTGAPVPVIDGKEGFLFQPCHFTKHIVEWIPRNSGGGLVARHAFVNEDREMMERAALRLGARKVIDQNKGTQWITPDGHELIETRYHTGNVNFNGEMWVPFCIPFSGSGHAVSKLWNTNLNTMCAGKCAAWATVWHFTTKPRRNVKGEWYVLDPQFNGWIPDSMAWLYDLGTALHNSLTSGERELGSEETEHTDEVPF